MKFTKEAIEALDVGSILERKLDTGSCLVYVKYSKNYWGPVSYNPDTRRGHRSAYAKTNTEMAAFDLVPIRPIPLDK